MMGTGSHAHSRDNALRFFLFVCFFFFVCQLQRFRERLKVIEQVNSWSISSYFRLEGRYVSLERLCSFVLYTRAQGSRTRLFCQMI